MSNAPDECRALLHEAVRSMAQQVGTIALVTAVARDEGGAVASVEALLRVEQAARTTLAELRLVARILERELDVDADVATPAPPRPTALAGDCLGRARAQGIACRWHVPPRVDDLPSTVRTSIGQVLHSVTELVLGTEPTPASFDLQVLLGGSTVDVEVMVLGGVDVPFADAVLAAAAARVRMSGGELVTAETRRVSGRAWHLWAWLQC